MLFDRAVAQHVPQPNENPPCPAAFHIVTSILPPAFANHRFGTAEAQADARPARLSLLHVQLLRLDACATIRREMPSGWKFLRDGAGILPASNLADPLRSTDLPAVEILVREAVQNSLDERRRDIPEPVRIRFERRVLRGQDKTHFVKRLRLAEIDGRRKSFRPSHSWFADANRQLDAIQNPEVDLPILVISDFNTRGLGGHWDRRRSSEDRFFNLVLSVGGSHKWDDDEDDAPVRSLGSYGFGKMAFAMSSSIRTVIYYSTFRPDDTTEGVACRAMASAFLPPHTFEDADFAGHAYLGDPTDHPAVPAKPLVGGVAHSWIRSLGLPERSDDDTGTTVVVPGFTHGMNQIADACAIWWWPRLADPEHLRRVRFEFIDEGTPIPETRPRSVPGLSPFIDCFRQTSSSRAGEGYDVRDVSVRPQHAPRAAGRLVLKAVDPVDDAAPMSGRHSFTNRVALVRDGLVIRYESHFAHEDRTPVAGVFVPSKFPETIRAFVLSEPPSHDSWQEHSERLRDKYEWGYDFLRLTKNRLRNLTRDFQAREAPRQATEATNVGDFLRRSLGDLFTRRGEAEPPPPVLRAFTIDTIDSGRTNESPEGDAEDYVVYSVGLSEHAPVTIQDAKVSVALRVLTDADGGLGDSLPCRVSIGKTSRSALKRASLATKLQRGERTQVAARGSVHRSWKTKWEIEVIREGP